MPIINVENLGKVYPVAIKSPGIKGTIRHFFHRTYRNIEAVKQVSFAIEPGEIVGFFRAKRGRQNHNAKNAHRPDSPL